MRPPRNIFSYVVRRPVTTSMLLCGLTLLGVISYLELPVQLFPDITLPEMDLEVWRVGYSADEMEDKVSLPVEAILAATPRVREIRLYAKRNFTRVRVKYEFGTDMRFAELDMQEKLNQFSKTFEGGGQFGFNVRMASTSEIDAEFMWIVVGGEADETTINQVAEDRVAPLIEGIEGVAGVEVGGGRWRTVDVVVHPDMLDAYDLSIEQVIARLKSGVTQDSYLGAIEGPEETHYITLHQRFESLDDIRKTIVDDKGVIRLGDVATISNYEREPTWIFHLNGKNVVSVTVRKEPNANPLLLSKKVKAAIETAKARLPGGYTIDIEENVADYIENILDEMTSAAVIGALLAMGVLFVFLRSFRMSLIVFVAIPISIIATFNMMYSFGMSINVFTLLGLAIGVGLLVDNSIVVLENVFRHFESSHDATDAAERGTGEVWRALVATTTTNLVVFTPILFTTLEELRLIFREAALAVIFPQIMSLLVSLTLVPMMTSRMLLLGGRSAGKPGRFRWKERLAGFLRKRNAYWPAYRRRPRRIHRELYGTLLRATLRHRVRALFLVALAVFVTWSLCVPRIQSGVINTNPQSKTLSVYLQTPAGSGIVDMEQALRVAEKSIAQIPEVEKYRSYANVDHGAKLYVELKDEDQRERTVEQVEAALINEIGPVPGALTSLTSFNPQEKQSIDLKRGGEIEILGPDAEALKQIGYSLVNQIESLPEIAMAELESDQGSGEFHFLMNRERAALLQVTPQQIARVIETTSYGGEFTEIYLEEGDQKTRIYVRTTEESHEHASDDVQNLTVLTARGESAPLRDLGNFQTAGGESRIHRQDMQRIVDLDYYLQPGEDSGEVHKVISEFVKTVHLPAGISVRMGGHRKKAEANSKEVTWMIYITILLIYMVMASIFESLLTPFVIMFTLPLAGLGVLWAMAYGNIVAEELVMFGMLILAGIVVNNGIVLLDFVSTMRREKGYRRTRAVLEGCYCRLRPILMTTLTTVLALLPVALKQSEEFQWAGLAVVVIAGLLSSTVLTLFVVPAMLMNAEDTVAFFGRVFRWMGRAILKPDFALFWRGTLAAARFALRPLRGTGWRFLQPPVPKTDTESPSAAPILRANAVSAASDRVIVRQVYMTYPVFQPRHLRRIIPSRRFKYGNRPPEGIAALTGIDLVVERGMCGLLGPNGAGKTTLMQIMAGLLKPTRGYVEVNGLNLATDREKLRNRIGYLPQEFGLPAEFTARQFLNYHALMMGLHETAERSRRIESALEEVNLAHTGRQAVGGFSGGMKQRLGIARVLLKLPSFLIVDEPTRGLDPVERVKFRNLLSRLSADRIVLFSTHIIEDISSSCNQLAVLHGGRIAYQGPPEGFTAPLRGKVWEHLGPRSEHADLKNIGHVLRHRSINGGVQYRILSSVRPRATAQPSEPTLEDSYMSIILANRD